MSPLESYLRPGLRGIKANFFPGLVLQLFALLVLIAYYNVSSVTEFLDRVGQLKLKWGYLYAALATAFFGGLIPYLILLWGEQLPQGRKGRDLLFYVAFWLWKGIEIDAFYRAQGHVFGSDGTLSVILTKMAIDQFIYNPLWAAPVQTACFLWKDCDYSLIKMRKSLKNESFLHRTAVVLLSTWVVWVPAVALIYCLPAALQLPLFNLVLCFWCLLLSYLSRAPVAGPSS